MRYVSVKSNQAVAAMKYALGRSDTLFGCPSSKKDVEPEDLSTELLGTYHAVVPYRYAGNVDNYGRYIYDVEITRAKANEVNLKIEMRYESRTNLNDPYKDSGFKDVKYFENGKVTETKRFVVSETRSTDWYEIYTTKTDIYIEGKLTGKVLALSTSYKFPAYNEEQSETFNLDKN